jgi:hypothetical protein
MDGVDGAQAWGNGVEPSDDMHDWMLGATINVFGNILINLGTNLVKLGHNQNLSTKRLGASDRSRPCLLRLGGWVLFVLGSCLNFASFSFAAQVQNCVGT